MSHKNNERRYGKFLVFAAIASIFCFASISSIAATPNNAGFQNRACSRNIQTIRNCLAEALGCEPTDRSIRKALAPVLANNKTAASAGSSLSLVTGISRAQSAAP